MSKDGLLVLSDKGNNNNIYRTVSKTSFNSALPKRPSILLPNEPLQSLRFTRYGSTVFEVYGDNPTGITVHDPSLPTPVTTGIATLIEGALETSNSSLNDVLPELSLAQKLFSSVSKIINVHNSNLDVTVNLVR